MSALAMSGCQIVLFTTGRGTPFGTFVPTAKISTNTRLYNFKINWIDFDAGQLLAGKPFETLLDELITFVVDTCNGSKLKHEKAGFREIAIFKTGVTL
jgi:altronate hydrolase